MSQMDRSLDPDLRKELLDEIRWFLPAFLSAATVEREDPVEAAAELLGLKPSELQRVLAIHALLSPPVRAFLAALPEGTRCPMMSSVRPRVAGRVVTSGIDWAATTRHRATSSPLEPEWVIRSARRIFDIPENQALAWLLKELRDRVTAVRQPAGTGSAWQREIQQDGATVDRHRRLAWLEGVPSEWPGDNVYEQLHADRRRFYKTKVAPAARSLRKLLHRPSAQDIVDAICDRYFEPTQDWKLFEIAVLMRISNSLADVGERCGSLSLLDRSKSAFASFRILTGRVVRIWYQGWPPSSGESELLDAVQHYAVSEGGYSRPDVVIEFVDGNVATRIILLELKASDSSSYLASGFSQLLSYLRERPALTTYSPSGWLVAPYHGDSSSEPEGRALWLVSANDVASAVVTTALSGSPTVGDEV